MKIFLLQADHPTNPTRVLKPFATMALANIEAARLTNLVLEDYLDEDDKPHLAADATPENWQEKFIEYKQHHADDLGIDMDMMTDDDDGDIWIEEMDLIGAEDMKLIKPITIMLDDDTRASIQGRSVVSHTHMKEWHGGAPPLLHGTDVFVRLRHGGERVAKVGEGYATRWTHTGDKDDIVAYALYLSKEAARNFVVEAGDALWTGEVDLLPGKTTDAVGIDDASGVGKTEGER